MTAKAQERGVICCTIPADLHDLLIQKKLISGVPVRLTVEEALRSYFEAQKAGKNNPNRPL
jgi:hypothetical protein